MPPREYIRQTILRPLGMRSSGWSPEEVGPDRLVVGYRGTEGYHAKGGAAEAAHVAPLGVYDTAGGLYASINDMTKYLAFQLSAWPPRNAPDAGPVRRATVREMQQGFRRANPYSFPRVLLPSREPAVVRVRGEEASLFAYSYGFGFFTATTCEDDFYVHHDGELPGYETALALYPSRGYGERRQDERALPPIVHGGRGGAHRGRGSRDWAGDAGANDAAAYDAELRVVR
jgi:CubicO group peptidase (beta-lactamase class C family)